MVEQNARAAIHAVALAVVHGNPVTINLGDAVRAARVEGRGLALRRLLHLAEHLRTGRLVETDAPGIDQPDGFEHPRHAHGRELAGQYRLLPAYRHETHRRQVRSEEHTSEL